MDPKLILQCIAGINDGVERNSSKFPVPGSRWNVLSSEWFNAWKSVQIDSSDTPTNSPGPIDNSSLIDLSSAIWRQENEKILKKGLVLHQDFEILSAKAWGYLKSTFQVLAESDIPKYSVGGNSNETYIEIYTKPLKLLCYKEKLLFPEPITFYISYKDKARALYVKIRKLLRIHMQLQALESELRIWVVDPSLSIAGLHKSLDTAVIFPGKLLENNFKFIEDCEILDDDLLCIEIKEIAWKYSEAPLSRNSKPLQITYNEPEYKYQTFTYKKLGLVGLQNLGNTCYMNSGLQCLSNTRLLTKYILSEKHKSEINYCNTLGTKGELITEYANLITELWRGSSSSVSPINLKRVFSGFARQFAGFSQHDSQEMLSFLLDGIHEDLNRVTIRPTSSETPSEGLSESQIADIFWLGHLKRNSSIITDLMYGQFKSTIVCPEGHISLTFDPFLMLSVPMPRIDKRIYKFKLVKADPIMYVIDCGMVADIGITVATAKQFLSDVFGIPKDSLAVSAGMGNYIATNFRKDTEELDSSADILVYQIPYEPYLFLQHRRRKDHFPSSSGVAVSYTRLFPIPGSLSLIDLHLRIYEFLQKLSKSNKLAPFAEILSSQGSEVQNCYTLTFVHKSAAADYKCPFCSKATSSCPVPATSEPLQNYIDMSKDSTYFEILWPRYPPAEVISEFNKVLRDCSLDQADLALQRARNTPLELNHCIQEFSKSEKLDFENRTFCAKCNRFAQGVKKMEIWRLPQILIFHLKRFRQAQGVKTKDKREIQFPVHGLDLSEAAHVNGGIYDLYAISNHFGDMNYGHYTAYSLNYKKKQWFEFDDSTVTPVDESKIISSDAYLLFYQRRINSDQH